MIYFTVSGHMFPVGRFSLRSEIVDLEPNGVTSATDGLNRRGFVII